MKTRSRSGGAMLAPVVVVVVALGALAGAGGCAGNDRQAPVGAGLESGGGVSLLADNLYEPGPRESRSRVFDAESGETLGEHTTTVGPPEPDGAGVTWVSKTVEREGDRVEWSQQTYRRRAVDGAVELVSTRVEREERGRRYLTYDPPLALTPREMVGGEVFESGAEITERDADDPDKVKRRGKVLRTATLGVLPENASAGAGSLALEERWRFEFPPALVEREVRKELDASGETVGEEWSEVVKVFGIPTRSESRRLERVGGE